MTSRQCGSGCPGSQAAFPRLLRALAQRIWAEKPACNRQTLSQVSLESAFASALTRLFPNSGENTAKDLVRIIKMPLKCFSTKIGESRRAGENPLPGQLGWVERLGSLSLLPSPGPRRRGGHRHLSWSRASSAKGNCRKWGRDGYAGIFFPCNFFLPSLSARNALCTLSASRLLGFLRVTKQQQRNPLVRQQNWGEKKKIIALLWGQAYLRLGKEGALCITTSYSERGEIQAF